MNYFSREYNGSFTERILQRSSTHRRRSLRRTASTRALSRTLVSRPLTLRYIVHLVSFVPITSPKATLQVARQYREYMERELADTDLLMSQASRNAALASCHTPPYLVFTHLGSECLIMVFSDGTTQVGCCTPLNGTLKAPHCVCRSIS